MFSSIRASAKNPSTTAVVRDPSQRPIQLASKCASENIIVSPLCIGRNTHLTLPDEMRGIFPVDVTNFYSDTAPSSVGNPVLKFPMIMNERKTALRIVADEGKNTPAYFDFLQFGKLKEKEYEICYSTSLGAHGNILLDFKVGRAYVWTVDPSSPLDTKNIKKEVWQLKYSGLLDPGCLIRAARQPHVTRYENGAFHFSEGRNPLTLNAELIALLDVEIVGSGILFSIKQPGSTFRYQGGDYQHIFVSLSTPKEVGGKTYYGGQSTTFHNTGKTFDTNVVDLHQALLRQVLFGSVNKSIQEELEILSAADVFLGYQELSRYHHGYRNIAAAPDGATPAVGEQWSNFEHAADILYYFASKLEDPNEALMMQCKCTFDKLQAYRARAVDSEDDVACQLADHLFEKARGITDEGKKIELLRFFSGQGWPLEHQQLFPST